MEASDDIYQAAAPGILNFVAKVKKAKQEEANKLEKLDEDALERHQRLIERFRRTDFGGVSGRYYED